MARGRSRASHAAAGEIAAVQSATTGYGAKLWAMADALGPQRAEGARLDKAIAANLAALGCGS